MYLFAGFMRFDSQFFSVLWQTPKWWAQIT